MKQVSLNWYKEVHVKMTKNKVMRLSLLFSDIFNRPNVAVLTWVDNFLIVGDRTVIKTMILT